MKVVVTGASGYLGGNLCRALLAEEQHVRAFVRRSSDLSCLPPICDTFELAYGDVTDLPSLLDACSGCDVVFHTASLSPGSPTPLPSSQFIKGSYFAQNTRNRLLMIQTLQIHQGKLFCTEYEKSKSIADTIALKAATGGIPIILLYPGVIYGPGKITAGNLVARTLIERFNGRLPGYIGDGSDMVSFCHVDDVVSGHIAALHKGRVGERYLLTGENASFTHVFDIAALITNTNKPFFHIPLSLVELYGWISVFVSRITGKLPLISYPAVRVMRHQWAYSCDKAKKDLGYSPRSLKEGLEDILPWLKRSGLIKY